MAPILSKALSVLALLSALVSASPLEPRCGPSPLQLNLKDIKLPLTNGSANGSLPGPGNLTLKAIAIGVGFQNYTCNSSSALTTPVSVGAVASLFNAADLLRHIPATKDEKALDYLPTWFFRMGREKADKSGHPQLGEHHFDSAGEPVFDLTSSNIGFFVGSKVGDVAAPKWDSHGEFGSVDWLALDAKAGSTGIQKVYRVMTAGGKPPKTCMGQKAKLREPYAAQYFFYG